MLGVGLNRSTRDSKNPSDIHDSHSIDDQQSVEVIAEEVEDGRGFGTFAKRQCSAKTTTSLIT